MKIKIKKDNKNISLYLPLWLFSKKILSKYVENDEDFDYEKIKQFIKKTKAYIKENGHFNLIEIHDKDGTFVLIRL